jgi:hypothetical protein
MPENQDSYWDRHHWGIIQGVSGLYCATFATWDRFNPRPISPASNASVAVVNASYVMPIWLWVGIVALSVSVIIPAVIRIFTKNRDKASKKKAFDEMVQDVNKITAQAVEEAKLAGGQARLLWHLEACARDLEAFITKLSFKWQVSGNTLVYAIGKENYWQLHDPEKVDVLQRELRDFKVLYGQHIMRMKADFPGFNSHLLERGYPSDCDYVDFMADLRTHIKLLAEVAEEIWTSEQPKEELDAKRN